MSEAHVLQPGTNECDGNHKTDDDLVGLTHSEQNNNVNKTTKKLNNNDEITTNDEDEKFDFTESDVEEESDSEPEHNHNKANQVISPLDKNCNDQNDGAALGDNSANVASTPKSSPDSSNHRPTDKRKATKPANLQLKETVEGGEGTQTSPDTYCPITPRRIVDVDTLPRSASSAKVNTGDKVQHAAGSDGQTDDDYYDEDEPDDEMLVQFLGEANRIAEARLAARRQARAEAREIRMRELERQQKEQEHNADRVFDMHTASGIDPLSRSRLVTGIGSGGSSMGGMLNSTVRGTSMSSRRSSEDSLEEEGRSLRDIRHELKDVEERFRKAMIANAQLDNERSSQTYQIQLLKDKLEEMEETYVQLQREFKEKSRDFNALKRNLDKLTEELKLVQGQLTERDALIAEQGLVIVAVENEDGSDAKRALVSMENAQLLGSVQGSLDVRLKKFSEEKQHLHHEVQQLQEQLDNYKSQGKARGNSLNGPLGSDEDYEAQREANKIISDYKYKLQKAEQEIASLQSSLARSETQVIRYKSTAEAAEKAEAELKIERRKLQRENREAMERLEELETSNNHLLKRLDKLKNAKSALLKDL